MRLLRTAALVACLLPLCTAAPLLAFSTLPHFACEGQLSPSGVCERSHMSEIPQSAIPDLLHRLADPTISASSALPVRASVSVAVPELVLVVYARAMRAASAPALLERLSIAVSSAEEIEGSIRTASSFHATTDRAALPADIAAVSGRQLGSLRELKQLVSAKDAAFENGRTDVLTVSVTDEEEEGLLGVLHELSAYAKGRFAVLFTTRQEAAAPAADDAAPADAAAGEAAPAADAAAAPAADAAAAPAADAAAAPAADAASAPDAPLQKTTDMNPPEISEAVVTGLLVLLLFLIIFIPGFMCLWNIQSPQTFEMFDSNDAKKKMQ